MSDKIEKYIHPSLVSGPVAAAASLIIPGMGQILAVKIKRGLLFLASIASYTGLLIWRIQLLAHRETGFLEMLRKAVSVSPLFTIFSIAGLIILWLWIVFDAYKQTDKKTKESKPVFILILILFFTMGWEISQINVYKLVTEAPDAWKPLSKILWPWERAITYKEDVVSAYAKILADSEDNPPPMAIKTPGEPYIIATPNYGYLSTLDENNKIVKGTVINLQGGGFKADTFTTIWWSDSIGNEFQPRDAGKYVSFMTDSAGDFSINMTMPYRLIPPNARGQQIHKVEAKQTSQIGYPMASEPLQLTIKLIIETIFMGMMATLFGIIFAVPLSFLAARNLMSSSRVAKAVYFITRTIMNIIRSIEPLIWALIAVVWVGLGPFAGIVALTIHSIAALGKLYSEAIESIDPGPIEAIQATGANKLQTIIFAVVPQMIPPFVSFTIYRWDINVRMSTVIGMVGGGGIGFLLVQYIRLLDYKAAGIAVWFIAITVSILDYVSAQIRHRFI